MVQKMGIFVPSCETSDGIKVYGVQKCHGPPLSLLRIVGSMPSVDEKKCDVFCLSSFQMMKLVIVETLGRCVVVHLYSTFSAYPRIFK